MNTTLFQSRKAQISIQFNWIFVLIIGAIILTFFIMVIKNNEKRATAEDATDIVQTLDSLLVSIGSNPNTVDTFSLKNAELVFTCEDDISNYYIQGTGPVDTTYKSFFSANTLKGSSITTWTLSWNVPFETTTLTYLADDRTLFIFIPENMEKQGIIGQLYQELPEAFKKQIVQETALQSMSFTGYNRKIIITTKQDLDIPTNLADADLRKIPPSYKEEELIPVTFKTSSTERFLVYTKPLLWAAIFSEDPTTYTCNMNKAIIKLDQLTTILKTRTEALQETFNDDTSLNSRCVNFLDSAENAYTTYIERSTSTLPATLEHVKTQKESIETTQNLIKRGPQCPYIY